MVLTVTREAIKHVLLQNGAGVREGRVSLKMIACKTFKFVCLFYLTPSLRKENWYSIFRDFALGLWLALVAPPTRPLGMIPAEPGVEVNQH